MKTTQLYGDPEGSLSHAGLPKCRCSATLGTSLPSGSIIIVNYSRTVKEQPH